MKFHTLSSFIKSAYKEKTTWIGIFIAIFFWTYKPDIDALIHKILTNDKTVEMIITGLSGIIVPVLLTLLKKKDDV